MQRALEAVRAREAAEVAELTAALEAPKLKDRDAVQGRLTRAQQALEDVQAKQQALSQRPAGGPSRIPPGRTQQASSATCYLQLHTLQAKSHAVLIGHPVRTHVLIVSYSDWKDFSRTTYSMAEAR